MQATSLLPRSHPKEGNLFYTSRSKTRSLSKAVNLAISLQKKATAVVQMGNAVTMAMTITALPRKGWDHPSLPYFTVQTLRWQLGAPALMVSLRERSGNRHYPGRNSWFTTLSTLFQGAADLDHHLSPIFSSSSPSHGTNTYFFQ